MKIVIADLTTVTDGKNVRGHYEYVANMMKRILTPLSDTLIAGGPTYILGHSESEKRIGLPYELNISDEKNTKTLRSKLNILRNGRVLFKKVNNSIVIIQPYSFLMNMLAILFFSRRNQIILIEYNDQRDTFLKKIVYKLTSHKITGMITSQNSLLSSYGKDGVVLPDYIYTKQQLPEITSNPSCDFGMFGIMSEGKDVEALVRLFNRSTHSLMIAGYWPDKKRFAAVKEAIKSSHIQIRDSYLSEKEYHRMLSDCKFIILPYNDNYKNATSGVIFDTLFSGVPVVAPNYPNFKFVEESKIGELYSNISEIDLDRVILRYQDDQKNLENFLISNRKQASRLRKFVRQLGGEKNETII